MDEKSFKEQFILSFVTSYAVSIYDDCCMRGRHDKLEAFPWEDAVYLADKAWIQYKEIMAQ